jgi:hypothetical protein
MMAAKETSRNVSRSAGLNAALMAAIGACLYLLGAGCDTKNIGTSTPILPPMALFGYEPAVPVAGEEVAFDASLSTPSTEIVEYKWDFGDSGNVVTQIPNATHTYDVPAQYTVVLTVIDDVGNFGTATRAITIGEPDDAGVTCADYVAYFNTLPCIDDPASQDIACHDDLADFCSGVAAYYQCWIDNTYCDEGGNLVRDVDECDPLLDCT